MKRIIYALLLFWEIIFCLLYFQRATFLLFVLTLVLGIVSELLLILVRKKLSVQMGTRTNVISKGEPFAVAIHIKNRSRHFVVADGSFVCYFRNLTTGEESHKTQHFSVGKQGIAKLWVHFEPVHYGEIEIVLKKPTLYGFFHCFSRRFAWDGRKRKECSIRALVIPGVDDYTEDRWMEEKREKEDEEQYSPYHPGEDASEIFDIRDYREGDRLNRIHWKASYKRNVLVTKEYSLPQENLPGMYIDISEVAQVQKASSWYRRDQLVEHFVRKSYAYLEEGKAHKIGYGDSHTHSVQWVLIREYADIWEAMQRIYQLMPMEPIGFDCQEMNWDDEDPSLSSCEVWTYTRKEEHEWSKQYTYAYELAIDDWKLEEMWIHLLHEDDKPWHPNAQEWAESRMQIETHEMPAFQERKHANEKNHVEMGTRLRSKKDTGKQGIQGVAECFGNVLMTVILLGVSLIAAARCLTRSIPIDVSFYDMGKWFIPILLLCTVCAQIVIHLRNRKMWINLMPLLPVAAYCYMQREQLRDGFLRVTNLFIARWNHYFETSESFYRIEQVSDAQAQQQILAFCTLVLLLVTILASQVVYLRLWAPMYLLITAPITFFPFVVGVIPGNVEFGLYLITTLVLLVSLVNRRHRNTKDTGIPGSMRQTLMLLGVSMLLVTLLIPDKAFNRTKQVVQTQQQISDKLEDIAAMDLTPYFNWFGWFGSDSKGIDYGSLQQQGKRDNSDRIVMKVTLQDEMDSNLYLRGYAGDGLTDNGWESLQSRKLGTFQNEYNGLLKNGMNPEIVSPIYDDDEVSTMRIQNLHAGKGNYFAPTGIKTEITMNDDGVVTFPGMNTRDYSVEYYPDFANRINGFQGVDNPVPVSGIWKDEVYESNQICNMIQTHYLYANRDLQLVREETMKYFFQHYCEDVGSSVLEFSKALRNFLSNQAKYELNPPAAPKGTNYIDYFIFESHEGYCLHFASAAVMIFRSFGIPARLAEGYMVKSQEIKEGYKARNSKSAKYTVDVRQKDAHAWCEIYLAEYGWVPVEMTPGMERTPQASTEPEATPPTVATPTPESSEEPVETPTPEPVKQSEDNTSLTSHKEHRLWRVTAYILVVWILLAALWDLIRWIVKCRRRVRWTQLDNREKILWMNRWMGWILSLGEKSMNPSTIDKQAKRIAGVYGGEEDATKLLEIINRAYFDTSERSEEEVIFVIKMYKNYQIKVKLLAKWYQKLYIILREKFL